MSDSHSSPEYIQKLKKLFWQIGVILVVGTVVTVIFDFLGLSIVPAATLALVIAAIKAGCVIAIFMHLWWDINFKMISWTMGFTMFFFAGMMLLILFADMDIPHLDRDMVRPLVPWLAALAGVALSAVVTWFVVKLLNQPTLANGETVDLEAEEH